jgi:hypothetical protein
MVLAAAPMTPADSCAGTDSAAISCTYVAQLDGVLLVVFGLALIALIVWALY